jgi:hypothetical protein
MADELLRVEKKQSHQSKKGRKRSYHQEVIHQVNQLNDVLDSWLVSDIPVNHCLEVQENLEKLKVRIDEFVGRLKAHREPLFTANHAAPNQEDQA